MKMLGTNVLVTEAEKEQKTASGIILTESIDKGSKPGLVLSVGPEVNHIMKGQRVFLDWAQSMPVNVDGHAAVIVEAEQIKAVLGE
jgi:co-chaperonin GroES (HSP10)